MATIDEWIVRIPQAKLKVDERLLESAGYCRVKMVPKMVLVCVFLSLPLSK